MPHFNHIASDVKYKGYKASAIPNNLRVRKMDIVEYLSNSGTNDTYCLLRDRITTEQFKVPLSEIQIVHHLCDAIFLVRDLSVNKLSRVLASEPPIYSYDKKTFRLSSVEAEGHRHV